MNGTGFCELVQSTRYKAGGHKRDHKSCNDSENAVESELPK